MLDRAALWAEAIVWNRRALVAARARADEHVVCELLRRIGSYYGKSGDPAGGIPFIEEALATSRSLRNQRAEMLALQSLGILHHRLRNLTEAIGYYAQVHTAAEQCRDAELEAIALANLALARLARGDTVVAI